ncbi:MAG: Fic family protein [Thermoguttaceae bacterium]|nr:Fic family protein [Thermoguttaceae bacterium]
MTSQKISVRFFDDHEIRAVWDDVSGRWQFAVVDIVAALTESANPGNYWRVLKNRLRAAGNETVTKCNGFKLLANDGKRRQTDCASQLDILSLVESIPSARTAKFVKWFVDSDESIDGTSRSRAYALYKSEAFANLKSGTVQALRQIHAWLFAGLYDFAGQIRSVNIAKGNFVFAPVRFLPNTLELIENMPQETFDEIVDKYVEMNVAHPFREGNGRATRIWLDLILKRSLKRVVDWSQIDKKDYLTAMTESPLNSAKIRNLLRNALTDKIDDREIFMKGIDYSYYYESDDPALEPKERRRS